MRKRRIFAGAVVVALFAATAGIAYAAGSGSRSGTEGGASSPFVAQMAATCDAMYDSPAMEAMHDQMPAALRARCDAMHEQMDSAMGGSGMMGGSMSSHHSATEG